MVRRATAPGLAVALVLVLGCQYPISKEYRVQARLDVTVPMVQAAPDAYDGEIVIWGGKVLETVNRADRTDITVLASPLDFGYEPRPDSYAEGRFIARTARFLDPEVYARGRRVTVAGRAVGTQQEPLGQRLYVYPVVEILQIYLWPQEERNYGGYYYGPGRWYGPYGWPYYWWDPWYGGPYRRRHFR